MTRTTLATKPQSDWLLADAAGIPLGRLAAFVAFRLMGKHKPTYTPHIETGDAVIVINARSVKLTGNKRETLEYQHYTGYTGGLKTRRAKDLLESDPGEIIRMAVKRMLPKGPMGRRMFSRLHVYATANHPHSSQQPQAYEIDLKGAAK